MRAHGFLIALALVTLPFAGCLEDGDGGDGTRGGDAGELETRTLAKGQSSAWSVRVEAAIDSADRWAEWWQEHDPSGGAAPAVDFGEERVLALVLGNRPDTCHEVEITRVLHDPETDRVLVTAVEDGPAPGEGCGDAVTQPFHIVAVARTGLPVVWDVDLWEPDEGDESPAHFLFDVIAWSNTTRDVESGQNASQVITTTENLKRVWSARRASDEDLPAAPPEVDFADVRVLSFFVQVPDPCHGVRPTDVKLMEDGRVIVTIEHAGPTGGCPTVTASHGFFVTIPAEGAPVDLRHVRAERDADASTPREPAASSAGAVPWERLDRGTQSGIHENTTRVVTSDAAWAALWENHTAYQEPPAERPVVDFMEHRVVAVFMGERSSGCYAVDVTGVHRLADGSRTVVVNVTWMNPPPDAFCASVVTHPWVMIVVPAGDGAVAVNGRAETMARS